MKQVVLDYLALVMNPADGLMQLTPLARPLLLLSNMAHLSIVESFMEDDNGRLTAMILEFVTAAETADREVERQCASSSERQQEGDAKSFGSWKVIS